MKEIYLWEFILSHLKHNNSVILTAVVDHKKGSPGKRGFKMAVSSNGESYGSVGGGIMEYNILCECKVLLKNNQRISKLKTLFHNQKKDTDRSGLICSGSQTNFSISLNRKDLKTVSEIVQAVVNNKRGIIKFSNKGISFNPGSKKSPQYNFRFRSDTDWMFEQSTFKNNIVYIVGGGHVGAALSRLLYMLDFYVIVFDNRKKKSSNNENYFADKIIKDDYKNLGKVLQDDSFVVIVTSGFETDKEALTQVLKKKVKYAGVMGTKAKIKKIFTEIKKNGTDTVHLGNIHAPVGIDINSETPEEIAVSIAAEIIREKNKSR